MNDGFSFDSSITCSELFRGSWVNLGYIAGDRRQNLNPKFAQVPEQIAFSYSAYLVAAGHLELPVPVPPADEDVSVSRTTTILGATTATSTIKRPLRRCSF